MASGEFGTQINSTGVVVGQSSFQLSISNTREITATCNGTSITYSDIVPMSSSQWFHIATTYDGAHLKVFVNGKQVNSIDKTGAINVDVTPLTIGRRPGNSSLYFYGKIDEVRVFNVALTNQQLQRMVYQEIQNNSGQVSGTVVAEI